MISNEHDYWRLACDNCGEARRSPTQQRLEQFATDHGWTAEGESHFCWLCSTEK